MPYNVALISMPWSLANRASIQLGALKSFLNQNLTDIRVVNIHIFLDVAHNLGISRYNAIAENTWIAEAVYAYILNSELRAEIVSSFKKACRSIPILRDQCVEDIALRLKSLHEKSSIWKVIEKADLVGVSICLAQLASSLYFIRETKKRFPKKKVAVGGSAVAGKLGQSMLENVPEVDFVINGEGELPLLNLVKLLKNGATDSENGVPGLIYRDTTGKVIFSECNQIECLETLPVPDYDDYFLQLSRLPNLNNLIPGLPVEASRGCWWHRATPEAPEKACQFCNLNLQWKDYRYKTAEKVANEIEHLASRHATTRFFFVDNNLPLWETDKLFRHIEKHRRSYQIFLETRASVTKKTLLLMRRAGVEDVQIGIEGLSTSYLNRIGKGTTTIQNIEIMKNCEELGINNISNLLIGFPGATEAEIEETLEALEYVFIYKPLRIVKFWLGYNSPVYYRAKDLGLKNIRNHPNYRYVISEDLYSNLELMQKDYRFDKKKQEKIWRPVVKKVKEWKEFYRKTKERYPHIPILKYRDAKNFLIISRVSYDSPESECFRLRGASRDIYKFCDKTRSFGSICRKFPSFPEKDLLNFLNTLVDKKVMFREGNRYLSLAVNIDVRRFCS
ncbi:MAG TPA: RiPP maturation radical SAM protein 1 [Deltaproteobacteria bacterium]|nr:RiPP maturation radical SAM protein 1 [Deltaproteobacteria bacterium]